MMLFNELRKHGKLAAKDPDTGGKTLPPDAGQAEQGN